jgi:hypothetical protein
MFTAATLFFTPPETSNAPIAGGMEVMGHAATEQIKTRWRTTTAGAG